MDDDESIVLACGTIAAIAAVVWWTATLVRGRGGRTTRSALAVVPPACAALLLAVIRTSADPAVVADVGYQSLFEVIGIACMIGAAAVGPLFGISVRHDVVERRNPAAAIALAGAMVGATLAYAGANVGDGPTIWTTLGPAALALGGLGAAGFAAEAIGGASEAIVVDRDVASGARVAGTLVVIALILGRAVAGDWTSAPDALRDFARLGWPAAAMAVGSALAKRALRPTPRVPRPPVVTSGVLPAIALVAGAAAVAWRLR